MAQRLGKSDPFFPVRIAVPVADLYSTDSSTEVSSTDILID
jgi:hypothetical protein